MTNVKCQGYSAEHSCQLFQKMLNWKQKIALICFCVWNCVYLFLHLIALVNIPQIHKLQLCGENIRFASKPFSQEE